MPTAPSSNAGHRAMRATRALRCRRRNTSGADVPSGMAASDGAASTAYVRRRSDMERRATEMQAVATATRRTTATSSIMGGSEGTEGPRGICLGARQERLEGGLLLAEGEAAGDSGQAKERATDQRQRRVPTCAGQIGRQLDLGQLRSGTGDDVRGAEQD